MRVCMEKRHLSTISHLLLARPLNDVQEPKGFTIEDNDHPEQMAGRSAEGHLARSKEQVGSLQLPWFQVRPFSISILASESKDPALSETIVAVNITWMDLQVEYRHGMLHLMCRLEYTEDVVGTAGDCYRFANSVPALIEVDLRPFRHYRSSDQGATAITQDLTRFIAGCTSAMRELLVLQAPIYVTSSVSSEGQIPQVRRPARCV